MPSGTESVFYPISIERIGAPRNPGRDGTFALHEGAIYLGTRRGQLHRRNAGAETFTKLPFEVPTDPDTQIKEIGADPETIDIRSCCVGLKDLLVRARGDGIEIIASHTHWHHERAWMVLRISRLVFRPADHRVPDGARPAWETLYDTKPCLGPERVNVG